MSSWLTNDSVPLSVAQGFETPATAWANHDWMLGLGMVQAAEGGGTTIVSGTLNSAGVASSSLNAVAVYAGQLASAGAGATALNAIAIYRAELNSAGVAASALNAAAVWVAALFSAGIAGSALNAVAVSSGVLNSAGVASDSLVGADANAGGTIIEGELAASGVASSALNGVALASASLNSAGAAGGTLEGAALVTISGELNTAGAASSNLVGADAAVVEAVSEVFHVGMFRTPRSKDSWLKTRRFTASFHIRSKSAAQFGGVIIVEARMESKGSASAVFNSAFSHVIPLNRKQLPREVAMLLLAA